MTKNNSGYAQFCPVAITSEIICNRWTTLILRSFFCGATKFSEIQSSAPLMSPAILSQRLKELERTNIITQVNAENKRGKTYKLTEAGEALFPILDAMGEWSQNWLRRDIMLEKNLDPDILFWELRQLHVGKQNQVKKRRVAEFRVGGVPTKKQSYWMIFEPNNTEICFKDPGHEVDLWVTAHIRTLVEVWLGHVKMSAAMENGSLQLDGSSNEVVAFSEWFMLSHFAKNALLKR